MYVPGVRGDRTLKTLHEMCWFRTRGGHLPVGSEVRRARGSPLPAGSPSSRCLSRQVAFTEQGSPLGLENHRPVLGCFILGCPSWAPSQRDLEARAGA